MAKTPAPAKDPDFGVSDIIAIEVLDGVKVESDPEAALRKALLGLIFLCQDDAPAAGRRVINQLLTDFPPLSGHFRAQQQPLVGEEPVMRVATGEGHLGLVMRAEYWESRLEAFARETNPPGKRPRSRRT